MQVQIKSGQSLTEPVSVSDFKTYAGYLQSDQDDLIGQLITAARELLEEETGLSCIKKVYEVEFDRFDMIGDDLSGIGYNGYDMGWFRLPFSPVTEITSVKIGGVDTTYDQRGLKVIDIHPDSVIQTGTTNNTLAVEFIAGASNKRIMTAISRITKELFENRKDDMTDVSISSLNFDTQRLISSLNTNTGF